MIGNKRRRGWHGNIRRRHVGDGKRCSFRMKPFVVSTMTVAVAQAANPALDHSIFIIFWIRARTTSNPFAATTLCRWRNHSIGVIYFQRVKCPVVSSVAIFVANSTFAKEACR
jgi:hypothetical protein